MDVGKKEMELKSCRNGPCEPSRAELKKKKLNNFDLVLHAWFCRT